MREFLFIVIVYFLFSFDVGKEEPKSVVLPVEKGLFESDENLTIILKGNVRQLMSDRTDKPANHSFILSYANADSGQVNIPVDIKTRGHFRKQKENCQYPPLMIQFSKSSSASSSSVFSGQSKLKLVMPCIGDDYVIREWLVYKIYNLVTPRSFRARLVQVKLEDPKAKKLPAPFYGILLEEEKQMAARNKAVAVEQKLRPRDTEPNSFLTMAVFQYLIGNTDWSVEYLQNIKLLKTEALYPVTVPYDFDHAGIVNAPYAHPAEELLMTSLRERRYRGYCVSDLTVFNSVIALYNKLKADIYRLYSSNTLLDEKYIKSTTKYLDEFYATINDPRKWQKDFAYPCDKNGTGNVVIKGLKED